MTGGYLERVNGCLRGDCERLKEWAEQPSALPAELARHVSLAGRYEDLCDGGAIWAACLRRRGLDVAGKPPAAPDAEHAREFQAKAVQSIGERVAVCQDEECMSLALLFLWGQVVAADMARAASLLERACEQGMPDGCRTLADLYTCDDEDCGLGKDPARVSALRKRSCNLGCCDTAE